MASRPSLFDTMAPLEVFTKLEQQYQNQRSHYPHDRRVFDTTFQMIEECKRENCFLVTYSVQHGYDMSHYHYYFYDKYLIIGTQIHGMREMTYSISSHHLKPCVLISIKHFQLISAGTDSHRIGAKLDFYNKNPDYFNEYCDKPNHIQVLNENNLKPLNSTITKSPFKKKSLSKNNITIKNKPKEKMELPDELVNLVRNFAKPIKNITIKPKKKRPPPVRGRRKTVNHVSQ